MDQAKRIHHLPSFRNEPDSNLSNQWRALAPFLSAPQTEDDYDNLAAFLDHLIDEVGNDESHRLSTLMDTVGTLIEAYDREHFPFSEGRPIEVLKYFMKEYGLTQSDLPELGSQGVVSERLTGKCFQNVRRISALSKRFQLSPSTFF